MKSIFILTFVLTAAGAWAQAVKAHGFRIVGLEPNSLYAKLGFKAGDVIEKINGKPVTGPADVDAFYNKLKTTKHIECLIVRDGKEQTMTFDAVKKK